MKHKKNSAIQSAQQSWAETISDYILKRRAQTYKAYVGEDYKPTEDNLFKLLMMAMVKQLEQGHTVLILTADINDQPITGKVGENQKSLYPWQLNLLDIVAEPLFDVIDSVSKTPEEDELDQSSSPIFGLLNTLITKGTQLWLQSNLTKVEKASLVERFNLIQDNFKLMLDLNSKEGQLMSAVATLKSYQQVINEHPLFSQYHNKNSLSKETDICQHKPFIFQSKPPNKNSYELTLWLHRTWQAEHSLANKIATIMSQPITPLPIQIPDNLNAQQVNAVQIANENAFSIIIGGPGTGKTYTVAQLVIALQQAQNSQQTDGQTIIKFSTDSAGLALAAPTGKAAQRMQESLQAALNQANVEVELQEAKTIHRLLGIGREGQPRYHADNPLGEDIIIVDEASMLGVELANYLVNAVKPSARLILLGDANQLAAVEAGAVLADLCHIPALQPIVAQLTESKRFDSKSGIGKLATMINDPNVDILKLWQLIKDDPSLEFKAVNKQDNDSSEKQSQPTLARSNNNEHQQKNSLSNKNHLKQISQYYSPYLESIRKLQKKLISKSDPNEITLTVSNLMQIFNQFRVLSAGHHGEWGDESINAYLTNWHITSLKLPLGKSPWYHGRPIMVLQNNYELGLFNGDIGICLQTKGGGSGLEVFFENKTQAIAVNLLNEELVSTAYAMTIHKSQGSEFDHVAITFDHSHSRLLSKELIYTAVTRAKKQVTIYSNKSAFETAVQTPTIRHTGLGLHFQPQ